MENSESECDEDPAPELEWDPEFVVKTEFPDDDDFNITGNDDEFTSEVFYEDSQTEQVANGRRYTKPAVRKIGKKKKDYSAKLYERKLRRREGRARELDDKCREDLQVLEALMNLEKVEPGEEFPVHPQVAKAWGFVDLRNGGRRRKTIDEMTPEERVTLRDLWRLHDQTEKKRTRSSRAVISESGNSKDVILTKSTPRRATSGRRKPPSKSKPETGVRRPRVNKRTSRSRAVLSESGDSEDDSEPVSRSRRTASGGRNTSGQSPRVKHKKVGKRIPINELTPEMQEYTRRKNRTDKRLQTVVRDREKRANLYRVDFSDGEGEVKHENDEDFTIYEVYRDGHRERRERSSFTEEEQGFIRALWKLHVQGIKKAGPAGGRSAMGGRMRHVPRPVDPRVKAEREATGGKVRIRPPETEYAKRKHRIDKRLRRVVTDPEKRKNLNRIDFSDGEGAEKEEDDEGMTIYELWSGGYKEKKERSSFTEEELGFIQELWRFHVRYVKVGPCIGGKAKAKLSQSTPKVFRRLENGSLSQIKIDRMSTAEREFVKKLWREGDGGEIASDEKSVSIKREPGGDEGGCDEVNIVIEVNGVGKSANEMSDKERDYMETRWRRKEEIRRRDAEQKRKRRAELKQKGGTVKVDRSKILERRRRRMQNMTEEEKSEYRMAQYMARVARLSRMAPEEKERIRQKGREIARRQQAKKRERLGAEKVREIKKKWWHSMPPEMKARYLKNQREYVKRRMEEMKKDPEKYAEYRKRVEEKRRFRVMEERVKKGLPIPEYKPRRKRGTSGIVRGHTGKTKTRYDWKKHLSDNFTPEQIKVLERVRKRDCNQRTQLKKRLKDAGLPQEEIDKQVKELIAIQDSRPPALPRPGEEPPTRSEFPIKRTRKKKSTSVREVFPGKFVSESEPVAEPEVKPVVTHEISHKSQQYPSIQGTSQQQIQSTSHSSVPSVSYPYHQAWGLPLPFQNTFPGVQYQDNMNQSVSSVDVADHSTTSSHHDYGNNCFDDENDSHSGPVSPGGESFEEEPTLQPKQDVYQQQHQLQQVVSLPQMSLLPHQYAQLPTTSGRMPKNTYPKPDPELRGPRGGILRPGRKYYYQPPKNPNAVLRTKQRDVIRDVTCDICGQAFNRLSLPNHKMKAHNPNYDNVSKTCKICGDYFKFAHPWYEHFKKVHGGTARAPKKNANHVCEECGSCFTMKPNLVYHIKMQHTEKGKVKKDKLMCPLCPKAFSFKFALKSHCQTAHPDQLHFLSDFACPRCPEKFIGEKELHAHLKGVHPDSYFPCEFCTSVKYTEIGLRFHHRKCRKAPKEVFKEWSKRTEYFPEGFLVPCELCKQKYTVSSLSRHYKEMHGVTEDDFRCLHCGKTFLRREYWMIHTEEMHSQPLDSFFETVGLLNAVNREGMTVKPISIRGKRKVMYKSAAKKGKCGSRKWEDTDEDSTSNSEESEVEEETKKKCRKIKVIAEEDEGEPLKTT